GLPAELARGTVHVAVEDRLGAEGRRRRSDGDLSLKPLLQHRHEVFERETEGRSSADVVSAARDGSTLLRRGEIEVHEVVDPQEIADLEAMAVERDRQGEDGGQGGQ